MQIDRAVIGIWISSLLVLGNGCATSALGTGRVMQTEADKRVVTTMPVGIGSGHGEVRPDQITCAEPSPDVQKIISTTTDMAAQLEGALKNPNINTEASLNTTLALSMARAEAVTQLTQRLATIQLLRDGMYRACEAYANGAISDTAYSLILSRYGDVMVTMLLGELAAGRTGSVVSMGSSAEGGAGPGAGSTDGSGAASADGSAAPHRIGTTNAKAVAGPTNGFQLTSGAGGAATAEIAAQLGQLQQRYLYNDQIGPMLVACVSALDRQGGVITPFTQVCQRAMATIEPEIPQMIRMRMEQGICGSNGGCSPQGLQPTTIRPTALLKSQ